MQIDLFLPIHYVTPPFRAYLVRNGHIHDPAAVELDTISREIAQVTNILNHPDYLICPDWSGGDFETRIFSGRTANQTLLPSLTG